MLDYPKIIVWSYLGENSKIMSKTESDLAEFRENLDLDQEKHESVDSYETEDEVPGTENKIPMVSSFQFNI